jgi:hypothetical protein
MNTWNSYLSPEEVADTVSFYNEAVGETRHVSAETAINLVEQAFNYYSYLGDDERADAIRYDLQSFCEYATTAFNVEESLEFSDRYLGLLASGHPYSGKMEKQSMGEWLSGAPELTSSARSAIVASLSPEADDDLVRHANIRLTLMAERGELSPTTMLLLEQALSS